ncbi:hypothetical protein [Pseudomonas sp. MYb193]|nr:hypothetical protein [Pseudomonas sp. MYb193]AVJ24079.1 hypothetical protein CLM72_21055 [Pseudomonas sp. MYb193]
MAVRKKSETINLRVSPESKNLLEGMSNVLGKTATQIIEELIAVAAKSVQLKKLGDIVDTESLKDEGLDLPTVVEAAYVEGDPVLTKLRMFYIAPSAVGERDKLIVSAIVESLDIFFGPSELFSDEDIPLKSDFRSMTPMLDLHKIYNKWDVLEEYAVFRGKNKSLNSTFSAFLKLTNRD